MEGGADYKGTQGKLGRGGVCVIKFFCVLIVVVTRLHALVKNSQKCALKGSEFYCVKITPQST